MRESAIAETKSSMGDKYETGREMMMQERNKLNKQLDICVHQLTALNAIDLDKIYTEVRHGALVETNKGLFFISVALGALEKEKVKFFAISGEAPIAKQMIGKKRNDNFYFNNQQYNISGLQ
ncbi:MAG: hypothetical protein RLP12_08185 [Ekhidna sp.]